ncbi:sigma factor-like helix-turn-helix DNA-binding protein [Anthropogastromicrobium aceti]|uniref:RNA polymerase sigma-70 region 4 domain-containing protein n=1 Tax=Anthropogastromicrobium aceti TaxID=2981768 RepID=A0AAE3JB43_9FIRM|nr:sigma factor-like helix-turn-helix DNA-binding protein [Anthropogastromicrobium aceti]MCC2220900.1 hypothetical protein [Anthropogastromicrobium aceti]
METEGMTRERLEAYRSNRDEIKELKYKLDHLGEGDSLIGNDVIFDYRKGYPMPQAVVGYDYELGAKRRKRYKTQIVKLEAEQDCIEEWVFGIRDSRTRRIFQMYFLEGLTQEKVGRKMNMDRSVVSRKIDSYLKFAHKTQKTHL